MKNLVLAATLSLVVLSGCSAEIVFVTDEQGAPVQGAEVYAQSLSISVGPTKTNAGGTATVPSNSQGKTWIAVTKQGYQNALMPVPEKWPLNITLKKN